MHTLTARITALLPAALAMSALTLLADPTAGRLTFTQEIIYDPQPAQLHLEHVLRLTAPGAVPGKLEGFVMITLDGQPDDGLTGKVNEITRKLENLMSAEAARKYGRAIPASFTAVYTDNSAELIRAGYKKEYDEPVTNGTRTGRIRLYVREAIPTDADYGEARASFTLQLDPKMDAVTRLRLNASHTPIRIQHRNAPAGVDANVLKVKMARFQNEVEAEAARIVQDLNQRSPSLGRADIERFANGEPQIEKPLTFTAFAGNKTLPLVIRGQLGRRVIIDVPGNP